MSSTVSSALATSTANTCSTKNYQLPTTDVACALVSTTGGGANYTDVLQACCKDAPVTSYADGCGHYCLASGQSAGDLIKCLQSQGGSPGDIFCSGNNTATATGKVTPTASATGSKTGGTGGASASGSGTAASASSTSSKGAAAGVIAPQTVSKAGLGMLAMLFVSAAIGTLL